MTDRDLRVDVELVRRFDVRTIAWTLASASSAIAIDGASGAGKTSLLRAMVGLDRATEGRLVLDGQVLEDTRRGVHVPAWQRRFGWVPQSAALFPHATVRANLAWAGVGARFDEVVALLELAPLLPRGTRFLSGGERQRVALGRALLAEPRWLLLDEPFAALDRPLRRRMTAAVRTLTRDRVPLILVSHDAEDVATLAEEVWTLADGKLALAGSPQRRPDP